MTADQARALIAERFSGSQVEGDTTLTVSVPPEAWRAFAQFAKETLGCRFFSFMSANDWKEAGLEVVAKVDNTTTNLAVLMKAKLGPGVTVGEYSLSGVEVTAVTFFESMS